MWAGIRGAVVDERTGEPVVGATIVATGPSLQGSQTAIALQPDAAYEVHQLPAGVYEVSVYYGDSITRFRGVPVEAGRVTAFRVRIDSVGPREVVMRATPDVPCPDDTRGQSWHLIQASR